MIHADTLIENILLECPEAIRYLMENNRIETRSQ
jgi:hypothetical protein